MDQLPTDGRIIVARTMSGQAESHQIPASLILLFVPTLGQKQLINLNIGSKQAQLICQNEKKGSQVGIAVVGP